MAPRLAKSIPAAERIALAGENESQDSQEVLERFKLEFGAGVRSSLLAPPPIEEIYQLKQSTVIVSNVGPTKVYIANSLGGIKGASISNKGPRNASDALVELNAPNHSTEQSHVDQPRPKRDSSAPRFGLLSSTTKSNEPILDPIRSIPDDAIAADERRSQSSGNDALPVLPSALKKDTGRMSSDSPTQSNDGRSYEQYADNDSPPHISSQASHEHDTLHEEDTGFLNFKRTHYDLPDSAPDGLEAHPTSDTTSRSRPTSQALGTQSHHVAPPETPAIAQKLFQAGNGGQLMPPSQLFGQTQWTSAVRRASPTSSRPSPNVFDQNAISPNPISSPLKQRGLRTSPTQALTSSPGFPGTSSRPFDSKTPSAPTNSGEEEVLNLGSVTETPLHRFDAPRRRNVLEPIHEYKSLRKQSLESAETRLSSPSCEEVDSESEADMAARRRRRQARLRQEKASKSFPAISLPRSSPNKGDNIEVPSTGRTKSAQNRGEIEKARDRASSEQSPAQRYKTVTHDGGSQETVADSQEALIPPQRLENNTKASDGSNGNDIDAPAEALCTTDLPEPRAPTSNVEYRETIPETSPPGTSLQPPKLLGDIMRESSSVRSELEAISFPTLSGLTNSAQQEEPNESRPSSLPEPASSVPTSRRRKSSKNRPALASSPSVVLASSPQGAIRQSTTKLGNTATPTLAEHNSPQLSDSGTGTSSLSTLSRTPSLPSSIITARTETDCESEGNIRCSSSPIASKVQAQQRPPSSLPGPSSSLPRITTYSRSRERTRRAIRHNSVSTDELAKSSLSVPSQEESKPPIRKPARQSTANQNLRRESTVKRGIFEGMVFALSFQGSPSRRNKEKPADRAAIERMIRHEGGKILTDGFDELFQFDSFQTASSTATHTLSSSLTLFDQDVGFTALIADGHSRKVKYMQALALGIPCLAPKWIINCVAKKEVVDWSSYLLCAGPSAILGEAIRSRSLQPYDASTAKLADVVDCRPKLLDQARILLVMKKTKNEGKKLPYVFLAQVLGGTLVRVYSLEEARTKLRDYEAQDQPFDWVYVDDHLHDAQNALFGSSTGSTGPKKRKRKSIEPEGSERPPKRIRTLSDELVIQSLILGRLIEDGEMEE
ncbi:hypothetical protein GGS26DRAFT_7908 [Hypomontagnella submonticulosa]|nr:hypothetical protein GGS26DRAFT_7908 [Hypomontagnella submonticulosa]